MRVSAAASVAPEVAGELDRIIDRRAVRAVFQPLIDLGSGDAVGFEALARDPASLAVMPFVRPDVIKLDLRLVQGRTTAEVARIVNAVRAQAELTGARILAEGIEPRTRARFGRLSARAALTGAVGAGMPQAPAQGVRGASLGPEDPLRGEWDVIMVGPHFAAALVARDCGDDGPDADRRFDFVITHDRELVVRAAQPLLDRLAPAS